MLHSVILEQILNHSKILAKQGISGKNKEKQNYDKSLIHLPRHSSFTIMQDFAKWGNIGHNKADELNDTTDLTTKGQGWMLEIRK